MKQTAKFPKRQIKRWINELRSGKYAQAHGVLQNSEGYCCLGVACEVLIPRHKQYRQEDGCLYGGTPRNGQPHAPQWLKEINDHFEDTAGAMLSELNDSGDFTFDEIADLLQAVYIEEVLS